MKFDVMSFQTNSVSWLGFSSEAQFRIEVSSPDSFNWRCSVSTSFAALSSSVEEQGTSLGSECFLAGVRGVCRESQQWGEMSLTQELRILLLLLDISWWMC